MILNKPQSIRMSNVYGFNDALEGAIDFKGASRMTGDTLDCVDCTLCIGKQCSCKRTCLNCTLSCNNCNTSRYKYRGYCEKTNYFDDTKPFRRRSCVMEIILSELYHKYILCFSANIHSYSMIEKFCGKYGVILEYDVSDKCNMTEVKYSDRPYVSHGRATEIALDIAKNGFNRDISNEIITWKHIDFNYEKEFRLIIYDENGDIYTKQDEESLGIELVKVNFIYDTWLINISNDLISTINNVGKAIRDRGVDFRYDTILDFTQGNSIAGDNINKYMDRNDLDKLGDYIAFR